MNRTQTLRRVINLAAVAAALCTGAIASPAFAANVTSHGQLAAEIAASQSAQAQAPELQKTRAEVYRELVAAEKDGELTRENATYMGS